jgi:hypothetical protein
MTLKRRIKSIEKRSSGLAYGVVIVYRPGEPLPVIDEAHQAAVLMPDNGRGDRRTDKR